MLLSVFIRDLGNRVFNMGRDLPKFFFHTFYIKSIEIFTFVCV